VEVASAIHTYFSIKTENYDAPIIEVEYLIKLTTKITNKKRRFYKIY